MSLKPLPGVSDPAHTSEWIRKRLRGTRPSPDPVAEAQRAAAADVPLERMRVGPVRPAAVLIPIVRYPDVLRVLFTLRTADLPDHAGQVSFPGGSAEPGDADPMATALRETEEEISLPPGHVEVVGFLRPYLTITGFAVTPVVGLVRPGFHLRPDPVEVAEVFEVPFSFLLNPVNRHIRSRWIGEHLARYYVFEYDGRVIWGATAAMLVNLIQQIGADMADPGRRSHERN